MLHMVFTDADRERERLRANKRSEILAPLGIPVFEADGSIRSLYNILCDVARYDKEVNGAGRKMEEKPK